MPTELLRCEWCDLGLPVQATNLDGLTGRTWHWDGREPNPGLVECQKVPPAMDRRFLPRVIVSREPDEDGIGELFTLACGHTVITVVPAARGFEDFPCAECLQEYVEEMRLAQ